MKNETPANFLMRNSKGYPDFIMTMLVYFSMALFVLLIIWALAQYFGFRITSQMAGNDKDHPFLMFMTSFNDTIRMIVIGVSGSVFGLAGSYLLRRKFHDDHFLEKIKCESQDLNQGSSIVEAIEGFLKPGESSMTHPNFDDEEEDI